MIFTLKYSDAHIKAGVMEKVAKIVQKDDVQLISRELEIQSTNLQKGAARALGKIGDPSAVTALISVMKKGKDDVQQETAEALAKIDKPAIKPLLSLSKSSNLKVRCRVVDALGRFNGTTEIVQHLTNALKDENPAIRIRAANALGNLNKDVIDLKCVRQLIKTLEDKDLSTGRSAATALVKMPYKEESFAPLMILLKSKDTVLRMEAYKAICFAEEPHHLPPLVIAMNDKDPLVRETANDVFNRIARKNLLKKGIDIHLLKVIEDDNSSVKLLALGYLERLRSKDAVVPLLKELDKIPSDIKRWSRNSCSENPDYSLKLALIQALCEIGDSRAIEPLIKRLVVEDLDVKLEIYNALEKMNQDDLKATSTKLLNDRDKKIRLTVIDLIVRLKYSETIDMLIKKFNDRDPEVREKAIFQLGEMKAKKADKELIRLLKTDILQVKLKVIEALGKIQTPAAINSLIDVIKDKELCNTAASYLKKIDNPVKIKPLIDLLKTSKSWEVRRSSLESLGDIDFPGKSRLLINLLKNDEHRNVRWSAAAALDGFTEPEVVEALIGALGDEEYYVQETACNLLGDVKSPYAIELLKAEYDRGKFKWRAARALGRQGSTYPLDYLLEELKSTDGRTTWRMTYVLGFIKDKRAIKALINVIESDYKDSHEAHHSLERIGEPAVEYLKIAINNKKLKSKTREDLKKTLKAIEDKIESERKKSQSTKSIDAYTFP